MSQDNMMDNLYKDESVKVGLIVEEDEVDED